MSERKISLNRARSLAVNCQLLDSQSKIAKTKSGTLKIIEKLGYVQIDTISVVERAHHHTLWTRMPDYKHKHLHTLLEKDKKIFEYYGHALSYLPMKDYRYFLNRKNVLGDPVNKWESDRMAKYGHLMKPVLERIKNEGPLGSRDFEATAKGQGNDWTGHPKPNKAALDLLFWQGKIMIARREKNIRIFDLTERVLPSDVNTTLPDDNEQGQFLVGRALNSYGIATFKEITNHLRSAKNETVKKALWDMVESGEVVRIKVDSIDRSQFFALKNVLKMKTTTDESVHILSPFDNLIIQRDRIERLFDFDYTLECYVPAKKRKYGYFVHPILWGNKLIGKIDLKADRKKKILNIVSLLFEPGFKPEERFVMTFSDKIKSLAKFNNCEKIEIDKVLPVKYKPVIKKFLKT